jgi:hypothetical protein
MAISYPRSDIMGLGKWAAGTRFQPMHRTDLSRVASGQNYTASYGMPLWVGDFVTSRMNTVDSQVLYSALQSLQDGQQLFVAHDPKRIVPSAYSSLSDFTDQGLLQNVSADRRTVRLESLEPNLVIGVGDLIKFQSGGAKSLHYFLEAVTANGNGNTGSVFIEVFPPVPPDMPNGALARFKTPDCWMRLVPGSLQRQTLDSTRERITFQGIQEYANS